MEENKDPKENNSELTFNHQDCNYSHKANQHTSEESGINPGDISSPGNIYNYRTNMLSNKIVAMKDTINMFRELSLKQSEYGKSLIEIGSKYNKTMSKLNLNNNSHSLYNEKDLCHYVTEIGNRNKESSLKTDSLLIDFNEKYSNLTHKKKNLDISIIAINEPINKILTEIQEETKVANESIKNLLEIQDEILKREQIHSDFLDKSLSLCKRIRYPSKKKVNKIKSLREREKVLKRIILKDIGSHDKKINNLNETLKNFHQNLMPKLKMRLNILEQEKKAISNELFNNFLEIERDFYSNFQDIIEINQLEIDRRISMHKRIMEEESLYCLNTYGNFCLKECRFCSDIKKTAEEIKKSTPVSPEWMDKC